MCGVGMWHFDVGGFLSLAWIRRDREVLARSAEFAAFTQFFRSHEGINPRANVQFDTDAESLAHFSRMTRVYAALAPYHRALGEEYRSTGLPPLRLPALHYPDSAEALAAEGQYLYGRDLMVAPVLRRGVRSRRVRLPEDEWVQLWTGEARRGGSFRAAAPLGEPPVWYRRSSPFAELFSSIAGSVSDGGAK
jgi:alpha-glucosidase